MGTKNDGLDLPDTNVYRLPVPAYVPAAAPPPMLRGPAKACPACASLFCPTCDRCGSTSTTPEYPNVCNAKGCYGIMRAGSATHIRCCTPGKRVVVETRRVWGFLWRVAVPCDEPGVHLHQDCARCGWAGVALPATEGV